MKSFLRCVFSVIILVSAFFLVSCRKATRAPKYSVHVIGNDTIDGGEFDYAVNLPANAVYSEFGLPHVEVHIYDTCDWRKHVTITFDGDTIRNSDQEVYCRLSGPHSWSEERTFDCDIPNIHQTFLSAPKFDITCPRYFDTVSVPFIIFWDASSDSSTRMQINILATLPPDAKNHKTPNKAYKSLVVKDNGQYQITKSDLDSIAPNCVLYINLTRESSLISSFGSKKYAFISRCIRYVECAVR